MHVVVVGGGVIGLSSALYLAREGLQVTLVERNEDIALETSFANGGQLSYNYVAPLADPSVFANLPRWLLGSGSPLRLRPRLDLQQWRWCLAFLRACRASRVERTVREMLRLSQRSQALLEQLLQQTPIDFNLRQTGKLIIHRSQASLGAAVRLAELQQQAGSQQRLLTPSQCSDLEPTLSGVVGQLAGGIFTPGEATADCRLFCEGLKRHLDGLANVRFKLGQAVSGFTKVGKRITALKLGNETLEADAFIIASGIASVGLLKSLGISLPLYALRGYSLSVQPADANALPRLSVTDASRKIVYAPLGSTLRIAAMVDMGVRSAEAPKRRIDLLKAQVSELFPALDLRQAQAWAGLRPATALGKPIIDRAPGLDNLWLNVGHGALGFTLACASGEMITRQIIHGRPHEGDAPFSLAAHR
ncbi:MULTISPECIES: D-amino acid dehydrogenase [unclassified Pseudomonas]|uniref:D-amino acid dehydrogenase n=1 Tax=unclassified Pseudomonas TaxID=196821 RepID=UPI0006D45FA3|nr:MULTISPECIES: D-amino acid dehydrogenase [unclassified Pseudomonas]